MDYLEELKQLEEQGNEVSKTKIPKRSQPKRSEDKEYSDWYNSLPEAVKKKLSL